MAGSLAQLPRYWAPAIIERREYKKPPVGELIGHRGVAYKVIAVEDIPEIDWTDAERDRYVRNPHGNAPYTVIVHNVLDGKRYLLRVPPSHYDFWNVLPEHYAVCHQCGTLAPCAGHEAAKAAAAEIKQAERAMAILPGCCPACGEPITQRQKTITYPGPNVMNPLGEPDVRFHTRRKCLGGAERYEEAWVAVDPITRPRSQLTLRCAGTLIVHHDGTAECFGAMDCPSVYANHQIRAACYAQSHGCGRECPVEGHPGIAQKTPQNLWAR